MRRLTIHAATPPMTSPTIAPCIKPVYRRTELCASRLLDFLFLLLNLLFQFFHRRGITGALSAGLEDGIARMHRILVAIDTGLEPTEKVCPVANNPPVDSACAMVAEVM